MLDRLRRTHPGSSIPSILFFRFWQLVCEIIITVQFRFRVYNQGAIPDEGPVLIAANHQSLLDPPAIGCRIRQRQPDFVARAGLWTNPHFGRWIALLHAIPVAEEGSDAAAIREIVRRLKMGRCVLIFPEGSRSPDGEIHSFKRGIAVLVKRAKCPVVPAAIEGAFEAWPRSRKRPRLWGRPPVSVRFGEPIPHAELMADGAEAGLARIESEVRALHAQLRAEG